MSIVNQAFYLPDRISSVPLRATGIMCISFYYHMRGIDIGTLQVYTEIGGLRVIVWSMQGEQGDIWQLSKIQIYSDDPDMKVSHSQKKWKPHKKWRID